MLELGRRSEVLGRERKRNRERDREERMEVFLVRNISWASFIEDEVDDGNEQRLDASGCCKYIYLHYAATIVQICLRTCQH